MGTSDMPSGDSSEHARKPLVLVGNMFRQVELERATREVRPVAALA
jgi:hypothetical protein